MLTILTHTNTELNVTGIPVDVSDRSGYNTISIHSHRFVGRVILEFSLLDNPTNDDWSPVEFKSNPYIPSFTNEIKNKKIQGTGNVFHSTEIFLTDLMRNDWYFLSPGSIPHLGIIKTPWKMFNGYEFSQLSSMIPNTDVPGNTISDQKDYIINNSICMRIGNGTYLVCIGRTSENEILVWIDDGNDNPTTSLNPLSIDKINFTKYDQKTDHYIEYSDTEGTTGTSSYNFSGMFKWIRARVDRSYLDPEPTPENIGSIDRITLS